MIAGLYAGDEAAARLEPELQLWGATVDRWRVPAGAGMALSDFRYWQGSK